MSGCRELGRAALVVLALCAAPTSLLPQETAAPPRMVIRAESRMVLVDAVVRDKKGKVVRDLGSRDFRIWEDGKEQQVTNFSFETAGTAQEKSQNHYLLLLFDTSAGAHIDQIRARTDAVRFVNEWAGPDRYMAVANFNNVLKIGQNFTVKPAPLVAAINAMGDAVTLAEPPKSESAQLRGTANSSDSNPARLRNDVGTAAARSTLPDLPGSTDQAADASSYLHEYLLQSVAALAESMASIRGRKSLALIGFGGADSFDAASYAAALSACNRANVGVYILNQPGLKQLAEETGGRMLANPRDLAAELGKVAEDQDEHYTLGYVPPGSTHDCHALRVEVLRAGLDLRARNGYCNTRPAETLAAGGGRSIASPAGTAKGNLAASILLPYFYSAPNVAKVNVAMEIDSTPLRFTRIKGKPHAELKVEGIAYKPDGEVGGRFSDSVSLDLQDDKAIEAFHKQPLHYEYQFDLPPGQYKLQVSFTAGGQISGSAESPLVIEPWDGRRFTMSTLALAKESRTVADLAAALDDSLLEDRRPLIARSTQIVPSGSNRFRRDEPGHWYAEIYTHSNAPAPSVQVRILERGSGRPLIDSGAIGLADFVRPGSPVIPVALNIPVNRLAPGSYRLEVKATDPISGVAVARAADFEVEQ